MDDGEEPKTVWMDRMYDGPKSHGAGRWWFGQLQRTTLVAASSLGTAWAPVSARVTSSEKENEDGSMKFLAEIMITQKARL
ncbi:hypothetical protein POX_d05544 [Penicillium oxalicum]|uniref:hypothetical protein n=1 Tax=Penicillium oxalicum TaxID=69781 RepID=UPI0020B890CB|nr:hypothetical protein POX_d05544 [Penicillium oxalicum]KAI2790040.1 hypothetical protein POX_d05544 [Penicillium oxalicum]